MQKVLNDNTYKLEDRFWRKLVKEATGHKQNYDKQSWKKIACWVFCCMFGISFKYFQNIKDTNNDTSLLQDGDTKTDNKKKIKKRLIL